VPHEDEHPEPPKSQGIVITVDGEPHETTARELTANQILTLAGVDPSTNYLVEIRGRDQESFQGRGETTIHLHPHQAFVSVATGPTPVSNVAAPPGAATFVAQLTEITGDVRYEGDFAIFEWSVPVGTRIGEVVTIALQLPADLPATPPSGPHVKPRLGHPQGAVHPSPLGDEWEYWSRPCPGWTQTDRSASAYLAHLRALFNQL
jgi:hypothetical protein